MIHDEIIKIKADITRPSLLFWTFNLFQKQLKFAKWHFYSTKFNKIVPWIYGTSWSRTNLHMVSSFKRISERSQYNAFSFFACEKTVQFRKNAKWTGSVQYELVHNVNNRTKIMQLFYWLTCAITEPNSFSEQL